MIEPPSEPQTTPAAPPPPPPPWFTTPGGAIGLAGAGFVAYVIVAHFAPALVLLLAHGVTDQLEAQRIAVANIPYIVGAGTVMTLALVAGIKALGWLPDDPPQLEGWGKVALWVIGCTAACILGEEAISYLQAQAGFAAKEQKALVDAAKTGGAAFVLAVVVVGPIGEELAFRRFLFTTLDRGAGRVVAYVGSAFLFALLHFNPSAFLLYLWIALWCAFVYVRTGTIWAPVAVHVINNGFALSELLRGG